MVSLFRILLQFIRLRLILWPSQLEVGGFEGDSPSATGCAEQEVEGLASRLLSATGCAEWVEEKLDVRLNTEFRT